MFSGGAFGNASIFALGVMPYISASIVVQLLGMFVPYFKKLQYEGESGRRKMNQITRYLTILILCIQGPAYIASIHTQIPGSAFLAETSLGWSSFMYNLVATIILMAGSMFVMWLGERITDRGIGNVPPSPWSRLSGGFLYSMPRGSSGTGSTAVSASTFP